MWQMDEEKTLTFSAAFRIFLLFYCNLTPYRYYSFNLLHSAIDKFDDNVSRIELKKNESRLLV